MLSRRAFLTQTTAASLTGSAALAAGECSFPDTYGVRACVVGLRNVPEIRQDCPQWCWAACAELAFRVQGFVIPQTWFVERVYGSDQICLPATGEHIAGAISGTWTDANGRRVRAQARPLVDLDYYPPITHPSPMDVVRAELAADRLVIAGSLGHAIAITAMNYVENSFGQQQLQSLTVRDPYPTSGNKYAMSAQQFANGRLLMTVHFG